ncbi:hypothetical protein ABGB16_02650 [Micromonospora sp. B11E3]|uniref:hypothetical protein n=1 Tax=Micromonospora sp. B11E3 TaxID=3153562 RepID=UPI00325DF541
MAEHETGSHDEESAWPSKASDLHAIGDNWQHHAQIGWQRGNPYGPMAGYRRAAEVLATHIAGCRFDNDLLIYPFANCWRHHIELHLKSLLNDLRHLQGQPSVNRPHHKIDALWGEVRPLIVAAHGQHKELGHVTRVLTQLAKLDADGQEFRYSVRKDGHPALRGVDRLDLNEFHNALLGVSDYLAAVDAATDNEQRAKDEIDEYYSDFYG